MVNYEVEPELLNEFVPNGTEFDFHDTKCFASLVCLKFLDTKVLGISVPFHVDFEEVNLRFYVKCKKGKEVRKGVVFVKEIVPRNAIAFVARAIYGEPYEAWEMSSKNSENELDYHWSKGEINNRVHIEFVKELGVPPANSHSGFIIERHWGYTKRRGNKTDEYKVEHPKWKLFAVNYAEIDVDFGKTYGAKFGFLSEQKPYSVLSTKGSEISVYRGERLRVR